MISIIDYGMGNVSSIQNMIKKVRGESIITNDRTIINESDAIILPGVGSFDNGMTKLKSSGLIETIEEKVLINHTPFLGICLGMQLFASYSLEDGYHKGLNWIKGRVEKINVDLDNIKVPHIGWNNVNFNKSHPIFNGIPDNSYFYFIHSYYVKPDNLDNIIAETNYGVEFCSAYAFENYVGLQFHPERSGDYGLQIYQNFINKLI